MSNAFNINYDYGPVPTIRRFAQSDAFIRALVGPVGGGKSSGSIVEFVRRAQAMPRSHDGIRHSRFGVVRNCFDDQTEILTELRGWQLFKDLWASDKVATLNDGALTFETPSSYYTAPYTGEMIGFETQSADFLVTPDHHLWVSKRETRQKVWSAFQHEKACDTYGNALRRFKRDATWDGATARYDEAFFKFLGFWFAEGYAGAYEYPDRTEPHYRFTVVQKDGLDEVRDILTAAGLEWGEHVNVQSGCTYFRIRIRPDLKPLVAELAALGKATVKRLPVWIKAAPQRHLLAFINGWLLGDGLTNPDMPVIGFTASRHLADDLQEIALKAGQVATISKRVPTQSPSARERGIRSTSEFIYTITFAAPSRRSPVSRGRWYKQQYAGTVYCVEVSTHVVYVRRNGKAMWSGQTYAELRDTTLKSIFQWMPPQYFGHYAESRHSYTIKAFPGVDMELLFIAMDRPDDVKKLLSLELTGGFINEAREVPWAAIDLMQSRLGRYPAKRDVSQPFWYGMWMDTNPPDADSKFYRFFEEEKHPPGFAELFKQPGGMTDAAENLANLPEGYYCKLAIGKSAEWVKIYIDGKYGFLVEGKLVYPEYNDAVHCKVADPIEGVPIIRSWDFGLCYSDDTEVLTNHGWKLFKDVDTVTDLAASRDPITGEFEWAPIAFKVAEPYKGDLLQWKSTELDMLVTPEHRVPYTHRDHPGDIRWASAQWLADNMGCHHMVDLTSTWIADPAPQIYEGMTNEAFAAFMGLFLSEGSAGQKTIKIYQIKEKTKPEMRAMLAATGWDWRENKTGWSLYKPVIAQWLAAMGRQSVRRIPEFIRDLDHECLLAFINAYTLGDGSIRKRPNGCVEHTLFTVSADMAADFQEIAQKVGWNSSVRWRKPQTSIMRVAGLADRAITNGGGWAVTFKKRAHRAELHRCNFSRVPYDGIVYCLNVPHHTLYVRRNGVPHWNGNTPCCIFSQMLPDGRWLTFDEMTSDNMSIDKFSDDVLDHCTRAFRGANVRFEDWGDPAGAQRAQTDSRTCFEIMINKGIMIEASVQNPMLRQESVRKVLRTPGQDWEPMFILHPRCKVLRKGFLGGYQRRRMQTSGPERYSEEPNKNEYSHPHDALQYSLVKYFGAALLGDDESDGGFGLHRDYAVEASRDETTGY